MTETFNIGARVRNKDGELVLEEQVEVKVDSDGTSSIGWPAGINKLPAGIYNIEMDDIPLERP